MTRSNYIFKKDIEHLQKEVEFIQKNAEIIRKSDILYFNNDNKTNIKNELEDSENVEKSMEKGFKVSVYDQEQLTSINSYITEMNTLFENHKSKIIEQMTDSQKENERIYEIFSNNIKNIQHDVNNHNEELDDCKY
jgi:hypothetical protein